MAKKMRHDDYPLTELHRSGYEVADGFPDIRGWKILNGAGQEIGEVVELIFDPMSKSVRYLVVHIEGKPINLLSRDVLVPVGLAELIEETGIVSVPDITLGHLASLPTYKRGELNRGFERTVRLVFTGEQEREIEEETNPVFYEHNHFDQDRFYNRRNVNRINEGPMPYSERIKERIIPEEKPILRDRVHRDTVHEKFEPFREERIEETEHSKVPVVRKAKIVEKVRVNKDEERHETIRDKVRRSEGDVGRIPKDDL